MKILLASASKRRFELLSSIGHEVLVKPADIIEISEHESLEKEEIALLNAKLKAEHVFSHYGLLDCDFVLGADTVVILQDKLFGKAFSYDEAFSMLKKLSAQTHIVVTGYFLIGKNNRVIENLVKSEVTFRDLSEEEIKAYLKTYDWQDKAGSYGVQTLGASLVDKVFGSITNIIGLPVNELLIDARKLLK
jgi:septum formation protein